jgi:hypothetical protein
MMSVHMGLKYDGKWRYDAAISRFWYEKQLLGRWGEFPAAPFCRYATLYCRADNHEKPYSDCVTFDEF